MLSDPEILIEIQQKRQKSTSLYWTPSVSVGNRANDIRMPPQLLPGRFVVPMVWSMSGAD